MASDAARRSPGIEIPMNEPNRQIPGNRKALYYLGMAASGVGMLLFLSVFVMMVANFGNFDADFGQRIQSGGVRAVTGMLMMIVGGVLMKIGSRGWAGAGVLLDPERARKDVEPWARMGGGMVQDALSEIDAVKESHGRPAASEPQVKVRCPACRALNVETAKFCNQCGAAI